MEKIQLIHPEGKKAIQMDQDKYNNLRSSLLKCLAEKSSTNFQELSLDVEQDLKQQNLQIKGKLEWNLFWVTLDLESRKEITKDRSTSPIRYSLPTSNKR